MEPHCRIELLGGLRVRQGERLISRFRTHKVGALLAFLAYHPEPAHHRETLMTLLWPDVPPEAARNSLSNALSSLRHQLEPPGVPMGMVLLADRFTVGLNGAAIQTDVAEFEERLQEAEQTPNAFEQIESLRQALELYTGPLLPGYYEEWVLGEAARLLERFLQATRRLVRSLAQERQFALALDYAHRAVAADPLREEAYRDLMRLLVAAGQPAAALQQYRELESRLEQEMGVRPTAATDRLAQEIQQSLAASPSLPIAPTPSEIRASSALPPTGIKTLRTHHTRRPPSDLESYPTGTVTFLLAAEADTGSQAASPEGRGQSRERIGQLQPVLRRHGGYVLKQAKEVLGGVFQSAGEALACALACQQALEEQEEVTATDPAMTEEPWVRMALHSGDVSPESIRYQGGVLQHALRLLQATHNGQILCSEATGSLVRCECEVGVRLQNLGMFRLRGQTEMETLFQVDDPQRPPRTFPPPRTATGYVSRLPLPLTRFFGRVEECRLLQELLRLPSTRLVTLSGPGGIGKTRLAIEAARQRVESLAGAVWFVPLADLSEAGSMAEAILKVLQLPRAPKVPALEQVIAELGRQPCLLVLDNLEHLVEEAARLVQTLLEGAPTLTCLVTSRRALELGSEHEFVVAPLPTPPGEGAPEQLSLYESVQLFVDRAQRVKPDFQLTPHNAGALGQLCASLEGIPLALELAATRAQVLSLSQMLAQLDRRFDLLVSRRRDMDTRHRTLRATLDWSYNLLSKPLQDFLTRLSVFRGGWDLAGAEAVCEADEPLCLASGPGMALDYLAQLRENSLVVAEEQGQEMRFRMLETLREYAGEKLRASSKEALLRDRHRDYFLGLAEQAEPHQVGPEQAFWLERLECEHDNLRATLEWCLQTQEGGDRPQEATSGEEAGSLRPSVEAGLRLAGALWRFWSTRAHWREGRSYLSELLGRAEAQSRTAARAKALNGAGMLAYEQGDYGIARAQYEESLTIRREIGDRQGIALSLNNLGNLTYYQGDYETAQRLHEESLAIRQEMKDKPGIASSLNNLGIVAFAQGDYGLAKTRYEESLAIRREMGDRQGSAAALNNLGNVVHALGDLRTARRLHEESLVILKELGDRRGSATAHYNLGIMAYSQGDIAVAKGLFEECLALQQELGDRHGIATTLTSLGSAVHSLGDLDIARTMFEGGVEIQRALEDKRGIATALNSLAAVIADQADYATARRLNEESLEIQQPLGDRQGITYSLNNLGNVAFAQEDYETAKARYTESLAQSRDIGYRAWEAINLQGLGNVAKFQGDYAAARALYGESLAVAQELGDKQRIAFLLEAFANLKATEQPERAGRLWGAAEALRKTVGLHRSPNEQARYDRQVVQARAAVGDAAFAAAWTEGQAMPLEQAVDCALEDRF
ncbi:MAG TPA: tetratricopeptide repeat protein [Chthonomonadaceae bacterium]|nr:tetratricopeptide repeat protein [Chthonomonadaceae bacterium]